MLGIGEEFAIFIQAVLAGMVTMGVYDIIRMFRRILSHNLLAVTVEDVCYWIGISVYLFVEIYVTSDGSIRWFFVVGVGAGMLIFGELFHQFGKFYKKIKKTIEKRMKSH